MLGGLIATWAAQTRFRRTILSPKRKNDFEMRALARALGQLQDARVLTIIGVACVIGAAAVLWIAKPAALIQAYAPSGTVVCGSVETDGTIPVLRTAQGDFQLGRLTRLSGVASCPEP